MNKETALDEIFDLLLAMFAEISIDLQSVGIDESIGNDHINAILIANNTLLDAAKLVIGARSIYDAKSIQ